MYLFLRAELMSSRDEILALPAPLRWRYRERLKEDLAAEKKAAEQR